MTTTPKRLAVDLSAAAPALPAKFKSLAGMIARLKDGHSAHTDLSIAFDMLMAIDHAAAEADRGVDWTAHAVPALWQSAIILYVRATNSDSQHRSTLNLRGKFDEEELRRHERLCALRNDALAHFGPGPIANGGKLHEERLLLLLDRPNEPRLMIASKRLGLSPQLVSEVRAQVHRAMILAQREVEKREQVLAERLNVLTESAGDDFFAILRQHKIDLDELFGSHPATEVFADGDRSGIRTGMVWGRPGPDPR